MINNLIKEKLEKLSIIVATNDAGTFVAYTTAEPFFCLERDSLDDLTVLVEGTLRSYISSFSRQEEEFNISVIEERPAPKPVRVRKLHRLTPAFDLQVA